MNGNMKRTTIKGDVPQVLKLIYTDTERTGSGTNVLDPVRRKQQVYTLDGQLLLEQDSFRCFTAKDVVDVVKYLNNLGTYGEEEMVKYIRAKRERLQASLPGNTDPNTQTDR